MVVSPMTGAYMPVLLSEYERDFLFGLPPGTPTQLSTGMMSTPLSTRPSEGSVGMAPPGSHPSAFSSAGGLVDTASAFLGQDSRTTVMLKRIPRKMTSNELVEILNRVPGLAQSFDFLHIPWDSARNTSRGFAFVHFSSPLHVGILSDAVQSGSLPPELRNCELRYARIQGDAASLSQLIKSESH
jgi:hypothetical protein